MAKKVEIFITYDLVQLERRKDALRQAGVDYTVKVDAQDAGLFSMFFSSSRRARGTYGENPKYSKVYRLFVSKEDEELALKCINK